MAVKLRLMRMGKKKQPTYRVVAADTRSPRNGRFIEIVGTYQPRLEPSGVNIDNGKALAWLRKGAQPTEQVQKLLISTGVWERYEADRSKPAVTKLNRKGYKTGKVTPGVKAEKPAKTAAEAPATVATAATAEDPASDGADEAPAGDAIETEEAAAE